MISIRRHSARLAFFLAGALSFSGVQAEPPATLKSAAPSNTQHDGRHDFDFEVGTWNAHVKVLPRRLSHSTDWEEFSGTAVTRTLPMLEGWNESELQMDNRKSGKHSALLAVRLYNPSTHQWAIYGANIKTGIFDPPMIGGFQNDRGEFYSQDTWEGRPIFVRFIWKIIDPAHAHLEQAFSDDGGKTWETNWIYDGERKSQ
ncbi:MAG TPA: hypothetical protein VGD63_03875 [Steroidobacteraceae bacterium]